jgi:glycosyltransferase involved in cell wall biosynthesis
MGGLVQFSAASRDARPAVSIVIRAKNEAALLGETLARLQSQTFRDTEIVLVDSGSTDRTLEIARSFSPAVKVIEIRPEDFTYGHALNVGCEHSRGDFLVFLSAHATPANNQWLARLLGHFADEKVVGAWGGERPRWAANPLPRIVRQDLSMFLSNVYFGFNNANSAVRKSVWEKYPFNEGLAGSEDKEWAYRVLSDGHILMHDREAFVYHEHIESARKVWWRVHCQHLGFTEFLPDHRIGFGDMFRYAHPKLRSAWKRTRGKSAAAFTSAAAAILASSAGQYTGSRKWLETPPARIENQPVRA